MKIEIQATSLGISRQEIRRSLSSEALRRIEGKKIHPWIVGETGTSRPRDLAAGGNRSLSWPKRAIQALRKAVKAGTKLFQGHGKGTNSHAGRTEIGEVVETFERELPGGGLQAVAVGLLDDERPDLDVCSIEAEVDIDEETGEVDDVPEVSAVALGSSRHDSPAFAGARRLASLQFFGENNESEEAKETGTMTLQDVKNFIEERGIAPSKIFSPDDIREDRRFASIMGDSREAAEAREKAETALKAANEKISELEKSNSDNAAKVAKSEGKAALEKALPEGMTDNQKRFLLDRFAPAGPDDLGEDALAAYVENGTKEFAEMAKLFGNEDTPKGGSDSGDAGDGDAEDALLREITG
jgi:hypothetical protein